MTYKAYAGLGNRDTPDYVLDKIKKISKDLFDLGYTLRTNGSDVPGNAFESGSSRVELYLPWKKFNGKESRYTKPTDDAIELSKKYHPAFNKLSDPVKNLIGMNCHILLGDNLRDPVKFLICWSPDGAEEAKSTSIKTGIMSHAIKLASDNNILVFNLENDNSINRIFTEANRY